MLIWNIVKLGQEPSNFYSKEIHFNVSQITDVISQNKQKRKKAKLWHNSSNLYSKETLNHWSLSNKYF